MLRKFQFYERYGVEEYYLYDPDHGTLEGWLREGSQLREIPNMGGWVSPRLKVRFELVGQDLQLYHPDGRKFATYLELAKAAEAAQAQAQAAQAQAERERQDREAAQARLQRLAEQLRTMGVEPEA